jgi:hypothetical protein
MRLRFTIRDLLWLTLVVALATGWFLDYRRLTAVDPDETLGAPPPLPPEENHQLYPAPFKGTMQVNCVL